LQTIILADFQEQLDRFLNEEIYFHLETSTGSYAALENPGRIATCAYIRNGIFRFKEGTIRGDDSSYRVGLKLDNGWLYAEGLTDWELTDDGKLLLAGHDNEGRLNIGLELSRTPFDCGE